MTPEKQLAKILGVCAIGSIMTVVAFAYLVVKTLFDLAGG